MTVDFGEEVGAVREPIGGHVSMLVGAGLPRPYIILF
jgi:hypothetical protein